MFVCLFHLVLTSINVNIQVRLDVTLEVLVINSYSASSLPSHSFCLT